MDIKNIEIGVTKLRRDNKGIVILGCETGEEMEKLKTTVQRKLGENFTVNESAQIKPKLKIIYIDEEEWKRSDEVLINTIKKQNKSEVREEVNMKIVKRINNHSNRRSHNFRS